MNQRFEKSFNMESLLNQHSQNLCLDHNDINSQSRFYNILKEQSINIRACLSVENGRYFMQENMENFDGANTINFWQARQNMCAANITAHLKDDMLEKEGQNFEGIDAQKKKGLKFLSWILNRLLRKKKFQSNQLVNTCIGYVLEKQSENNNYQQQAQNVRRRIYDAINVMTAIGLVIKNNASQIYIRKPEPANPICFNQIKFKLQAEASGDDSIIQTYKKQIKQRQQSIKQKKMFLAIMHSRIRVLKKHIQRNKILNQKQNCTQNQKRITFPSVFLNLTKKQQKSIDNRNPRYVAIKHKNNTLQFMSELEALCLLYKQIKVKQQATDGLDMNYFWSEQNKAMKQNQAHKQNYKLSKSIKANQQKCKKQIVKIEPHTKQKSLLKIYQQQEQNQFIKPTNLYIPQQKYISKLNE